MNDLFGNALLDYHKAAANQKLITWTNLTDEDPVPLSYFFRTFEKMPEIEKKALELCKGKILDIGCGSGTHSLFLQEQKKLDVTAIDISPGAVEVSKNRGVLKTHCISIDDFDIGKYNTILLLMNGLGVAKTLKGVLPLLQKLDTLLEKEGQILVDSSDLIYLFDEEEQEIWKADETYYGELDFGIGYDEKEEVFPWLYLDFENLNEIVTSIGLKCEKVIDGPNYDYLARIFR